MNYFRRQSNEGLKQVYFTDAAVQERTAINRFHETGLTKNK